MSDTEDSDARIFGLMAIAEDQQKALQDALADLQRQQHSLSRVAQQLGGLGDQTVVQILAASTESARAHTQAVTEGALASSAWQLKRTSQVLVLVAVVFGVLSLVPVLSFWWERHELDALRAQRHDLKQEIDQMTATVEKLQAKGGRLVLGTCGKRLCVEMAPNQGLKEGETWLMQGGKGSWIIPKGY